MFPLLPYTYWQCWRLRPIIPGPAAAERLFRGRSLGPYGSLRMSASIGHEQLDVCGRTGLHGSTGILSPDPRATWYLPPQLASSKLAIVTITSG